MANLTDSDQDNGGATQPIDPELPDPPIRRQVHVGSGDQGTIGQLRGHLAEHEKHLDTTVAVWRARLEAWPATPSAARPTERRGQRRFFFGREHRHVLSGQLTKLIIGESNGRRSKLDPPKDTQVSSGKLDRTFPSTMRGTSSSVERRHTRTMEHYERHP